MSELDPAFSFWHETIYGEDLDAESAWRAWGEERCNDPNTKKDLYEKGMLKALASKLAKIRERYGDDWESKL